MLYAASAWDSGDIKKNSNCNQSLYYSIGKLCVDTDDAKLYKGTGSAVEEVGGAVDLSSPGAIGSTTPAAGTFTTLKGNFPNLVKSATGTLVAAEMKGQTVNNYAQSADVTLTMDAAFDGAGFNVILGTTVAKYYRFDPAAGDSIYLDGVSCTDGKYVGIASAVVGAALSARAFQTGETAYDWYFSTINGAWACE
jgi:hypothetical protein